MSGGSLTFSGPTFIGSAFGGARGTFNLSGGTFTNNGIAIGTLAPGTLNLSGGTLFSPALTMGGGQPGEMRIQGNGTSITIGAPGSVQTLLFHNPGVLILEPTANGAAGLSTINVTDGEVFLGGTLELVSDSYMPQIGDSWDVITSVGTINDLFATLTAPEGVFIKQTVSASRGGGQKLTIEVTDGSVWADFGAAGPGTGTELDPYPTIADGLTNVPAGASVFIKGDSGTPTSTETMTIDQDVTLRAINGTVQIGVSARRSGFVARGR